MLNLDYMVEMPPLLSAGSDQHYNDVMDVSRNNTSRRKLTSSLGRTAPPPVQTRDTCPCHSAFAPRRSNYLRRQRVRRVMKAVLFAAAIVLALTMIAALCVMPEEAGAQEPPTTLQESVRTTVQSQQKTIQACYEEALVREPNVAGRVVVAFDIETNGAVSKVNVASATLDDDAAQKCIVAAVQQMRFEPISERTTIRFPFVFSPPPPTPAAAVMADSVGTSTFRTRLRHDDGVKSCYQDALKRDEDLSGRLVIEFTISQTGAVADAKVVDSTIEDADMQSCVVEAMQKISLPTYTGTETTVLRYPFMFRPE